MLPDAEATMGGTMGRSVIAVKVERGAEGWICILQGKKIWD